MSVTHERACLVGFVDDRFDRLQAGRAARVAKASGGAFGFHPQRVSCHLGEFDKRCGRVLPSYPVNSADSMRRLTDAAGLRWMSESAESGASSAAARAAISGPTVDDGASYVFAVLEKPDRSDAPKR